MNTAEVKVTELAATVKAQGWTRIIVIAKVLDASTVTVVYSTN